MHCGPLFSATERERDLERERERERGLLPTMHACCEASSRESFVLGVPIRGKRREKDGPVCVYIAQDRRCSQP